MVKSTEDKRTPPNNEPIIEDLQALFAQYPQLASLFKSHNSDPYHLLSYSRQLMKTAESYRTLLKSRPRNAIQMDLKELFQRAAEDPFCIFPTSKEIANELLPLCQSLRNQFPFYTTNLNFSYPVCTRNRASLNVIVRLYNRGHENIIKIKIGVFPDDCGKIFWEVGFVDALKSIRNIRKFAASNQQTKGDYFLLQKLVDCTKKFIIRRDRVAGLDLTPAYYHVVQLCRRLGGRTIGNFDWEEWDLKINEAFLHSIQRVDTVRAGLTRKELQTIHKRYLISWLFHHNLLTDIAGRTLEWEPPRLIWFTDAL